MNNPTSTHYNTVVVGGQFRKGVNWQNIKRGHKVSLVPDPLGGYTKDTHKDPFAVAVFIDQFDQSIHVGYLPKELSKILFPHLQSKLVDVEASVAWLDSPSNFHIGYSLYVKPKV